MKTLVIGGTGTVGGEVVRHLLDNDVDVRVMTSTQEKLAKLPADVEGVFGNMSDKPSLINAMKGIDRLFFVTVARDTETQNGLNVVEAAKAAGVKRIVYMSIHLLEDIKAPHFSDKIPIENAVKNSGIPYTLIRPNNFFQNDLWFKQPLLEFGIYIQPIGNVGLNRVDVRDIAVAITQCLLDDGHTGKRYNIVGPDKLTGEQTAQIYSKHLGKNIVYAGDDLARWAERMKGAMPEYLIEDYKLMYAHFQKRGFLATTDHLRETEMILGAKPRKYDDFARELSTAWKQEATAGMKVQA